jgi:hypothetical protein
MAIRLVRAVQTSIACPAQWDAWDEEGNYYYLRFRHGCGEVHQYENENWHEAPFPESAEVNFGNLHDLNPMHIRTVTKFQLDDEFGAENLEQFAEYAGIELAPNLYHTGYGDHLRDELIKDGMTFFLSEAWPKNKDDSEQNPMDPQQ